MAWESTYYFPEFGSKQSRSSLESFEITEQCFIRKEHKCGKIHSASKSCFIACPTDDDLEPILELMSEKLTKIGIEPIIAVKERAYGQDIFCTKICGKIIESRFCIVILDDTVSNEYKIPNPNVYYEYGLMTSLRKHIIPLQKDGLDLAFNIQSYDTIKYSPRNISTELDRAIKDAIRITESRQKEEKKSMLPDKSILRKLEMAELKERNQEWVLYDAIGDTNFKGFVQYEKRFYLYLARIDETNEFQSYFEDLGVILYRTEKVAQKLNDTLATLEKNKKNLIKEQTDFMKETDLVKYASRVGLKQKQRDRQITQVEEGLRDTQSKVDLMSTMFIGFIINPQLDSTDFVKKSKVLLKEYERYTLTYNKDNKISFGDITVTLDIPGQ